MRRHRTPGTRITAPGSERPGRGVPGKRTRTEQIAPRRGRGAPPRRPESRGPGGGEAGGFATRQSPRFDENQDFQRAESGSDYIRRGDTGMEVRILQQGLIDGGYELPTHGVDGVFGDETHGAVVAFQRDQGIGADGVVGPKTMEKLHGVHETYETVAEIAKDQDPADPLEGTRALTGAEVAAFNDAIVTEPRTSSGALPVFQPTTADGDYEARIQARMQDLITSMHADAQAKESRRADPDNLHDWGSIEDVAGVAKRETDEVFGSYATGPAFAEGTNLFDAWEEEGDAIAHDPAYADYILQDLSSYLLNNYMNEINEDHGAVASRAPEAAILARIKSDFIASHRAELLLIHQAWPGLADEGEVFIQRFKAGDDAGNRDFMWEQFATIIHEYIHTLEHSDHEAYRSGKAEQSGGLTLREGMTDYFTKMVWETLELGPELRREVEGPYHDPGSSHSIPTPVYYDSSVEAERAVAIVGVRNALAAFFLGEVHLIGGP